MDFSSSSSSLLFLIFLCFLLCRKADGFKWHLTDTLPPKKILTFSERYMFATGNGPTMLEQGASYIHVDTDVYAYMNANRSTAIAFAIYAAAEDHHHDSLEGMCGDEDLRENYWAANVVNIRSMTEYVKDEYMYDLSLGLNGTYAVWKAHLQHKYPVGLEAWHNVAFQFCANEIAGVVAKIDGEVTFRNPYGFIPAELFGFLPFEGARMVAYVLFAAFFLYTYCKYRASVLPLHTAILVVFSIAMTEATTWYAAYQTINLTGQPYCCPFPTTVVVSLVLQVFRQTFSRTLLLVVSLGYGIVRPKLLPTEWAFTWTVSFLYFLTATLSQIAEIIMVNDVHGYAPESVLTYEVPELIMDVIFLTWIYVALGSTIRILTDYQQTYKLLMYKQLAFTIALFVGLFALVTVLILLDKMGVLKWPWQWAWAQQVLWEVLNFAVLAAVCLVCRPSDTSRLLSYASQLPTEDPDDDDKEGGVGSDEDGSDSEDSTNGFDSSSSSPLSSNKIGRPYSSRGIGSGRKNSGGSANGKGGNFEMAKRGGGGKVTVEVADDDACYSLPTAEDEEFGISED